MGFFSPCDLRMEDLWDLGFQGWGLGQWYWGSFGLPVQGSGSRVELRSISLPGFPVRGLGFRV